MRTEAEIREHIRALEIVATKHKRAYARNFAIGQIAACRWILGEEL